MNDNITQIAIAMIDLAFAQEQANVTSMREQLEAMVHEGRGVAMVSLSQGGDMTLTNVSEIELGGAA